MTTLDQTIDKIQHLPDPLIQEVNDFIDFLSLKRDQLHWQQWRNFNELLHLSETDMSDYLVNLESYEDQLARGEIRW